MRFISNVMILVLCLTTAMTNALNSVVGTNKCTYGPSYWCTSFANAQSCGSGAVAHCNSVNWMVQTGSTTGSNNNVVKPPASPITVAPVVGTNKCTYGPSFWCASYANAQSCGSGAVAHCNSVGWKTG